MADRDIFLADRGRKRLPGESQDRDAKPAVAQAKLGISGWLALIVLFGFLAVTAWYALYGWGKLAGTGISGIGWLFLVAGGLVTILVGAGLMGLVFYSSRKNFDR